MRRTIGKLTDKQVKAATKPGRHSDGGGLALQVGPSGSRSWVFMWTRAGKRTVLGLGPFPAVSLADARERAAACRKLLAAGVSPLAEARKEAAPTFRQAVERFLDEARLTSWRSAKHRDQWRMTLLGPKPAPEGKRKGRHQPVDVYCRPILSLPVNAIGTAEVLAVLRPIWASKPETASRLRGRIERVLAFSEAQGWREGKNPAVWRGGLDAILPPRRKLTRGHHAAMSYSEVPALMGRLRETVGVAAQALVFTILTAARTAEAVGAAWAEVDLEQAVWTIPAGRMKAGRLHRVPLSPEALAVLATMAEERRGEFVFPSPVRGHRPGRGLSDGAMGMLLGRLGLSGRTTVHGFRSAFRDWAGDQTAFPRELAEAALAHVVGDETERAYRRSDALERRRELMAAWARYCCAGAGAKVVALHGRR